MDETRAERLVTMFEGEDNALRLTARTFMTAMTGCDWEQALYELETLAKAYAGISEYVGEEGSPVAGTLHLVRDDISLIVYGETIHTETVHDTKLLAKSGKSGLGRMADWISANRPEVEIVNLNEFNPQVRALFEKDDPKGLGFYSRGESQSVQDYLRSEGVEFTIEDGRLKMDPADWRRVKAAVFSIAYGGKAPA